MELECFFLIPFKFSFPVKIFKGLTEFSLKLLFKEIAHNLMNKNLIIKFFKPKFILICILTILLAEDDIHQSVDVIITSEEILEQVLIQSGELYHYDLY